MEKGLSDVFFAHYTKAQASTNLSNVSSIKLYNSAEAGQVLRELKIASDKKKEDKSADNKELVKKSYLRAMTTLKCLMIALGLDEHYDKI